MFSYNNLPYGATHVYSQAARGQRNSRNYYIDFYQILLNNKEQYVLIVIALGYLICICCAVGIGVKEQKFMYYMEVSYATISFGSHRRIVINYV